MVDGSGQDSGVCLAVVVVARLAQRTTIAAGMPVHCRAAEDSVADEPGARPISYKALLLAWFQRQLVAAGKADIAKSLGLPKGARASVPSLRPIKGLKALADELEEYATVIATVQPGGSDLSRILSAKAEPHLDRSISFLRDCTTTVCALFLGGPLQCLPARAASSPAAPGPRNPQSRCRPPQARWDRPARPLPLVRDPTTWTILQHDGPNHLVLWCNVLPDLKWP